MAAIAQPVIAFPYCQVPIVDVQRPDATSQVHERGVENLLIDGHVCMSCDAPGKKVTVAILVKREDGLSTHEGLITSLSAALNLIEF